MYSERVYDLFITWPVKVYVPALLCSQIGLSWVRLKTCQSMSAPSSWLALWGWQACTWQCCGILWRNRRVSYILRGTISPDYTLTLNLVLAATMQGMPEASFGSDVLMPRTLHRSGERLENLWHKLTPLDFAILPQSGEFTFFSWYIFGLSLVPKNLMKTFGCCSFALFHNLTAVGENGLAVVLICLVARTVIQWTTLTWAGNSAWQHRMTKPSIQWRTWSEALRTSQLCG